MEILLDSLIKILSAIAFVFIFLTIRKMTKMFDLMKKVIDHLIKDLSEMERRLDLITYNRAITLNEYLKNKKDITPEEKEALESATDFINSFEKTYKTPQS